VSRITVEEAIQEAQKEGKFANLPGRGKPLHLDPSPDAVVKNLLKEANVKPEWIEVAQEIEKLECAAASVFTAYEQQYTAELVGFEQEVREWKRADDTSTWRRWWHRWFHGPRLERQLCDRIEAFNCRCDVTLARYASYLHQANAKIRRYNDLVPIAGRQRGLIEVGEKLRNFAGKFPHVVATPEGFDFVRCDIPQAVLQAPYERTPPGLPRDINAGRLVAHVERAKRRRRCSE